MNQDVKTKWVAALRSGEYKQGTGLLRSKDETFCCLGVLCQLYHEETGSEQWKVVSTSKGFEFTNNTYEGSLYPTRLVLEWAGLKRFDPEIPGGNTLSGANDSGKTFLEIADIIEQHL